MGWWWKIKKLFRRHVSVGVLVSIGLGATLDGSLDFEFWLSRVCFVLAAVLIVVQGVEKWRALPRPWPASIVIDGIVRTVAVLCLAVLTLGWVQARQKKQQMADVPTPSPAPKPGIAVTPTPDMALVAAKPKTLRDLFSSDMSPSMEATATMTFIVPKKHFRKDILIPSRVVWDFAAHSKYYAFYVPVAPSVFHVFDRLAKQAKKLADGVTKGLLTERIQAGDAEPSRSSDLTFSGRVFLYHEEPLTLDEMARLKKVFRKQGMDVSFRGPPYAMSHMSSPPPPSSLPTATTH